MNGLGVNGGRISKTHKNVLQKEKEELKQAAAAYAKKKKAIVAENQKSTAAKTQNVAMGDAEAIDKAKDGKEIIEKLEKAEITKPLLEFKQRTQCKCRSTILAEKWRVVVMTRSLKGKTFQTLKNETLRRPQWHYKDYTARGCRVLKSSWLGRFLLPTAIPEKHVSTFGRVHPAGHKDWSLPIGRARWPPLSANTLKSGLQNLARLTKKNNNNKKIRPTKGDEHGSQDSRGEAVRLTPLPLPLPLPRSSSNVQIVTGRRLCPLPLLL
eukprot:jgi/Botrbrau1/14199/Bobra.0291s0004.1